MAKETLTIQVQLYGIETAMADKLRADVVGLVEKAIGKENLLANTALRIATERPRPSRPPHTAKPLPKRRKKKT